MSHRRVIQTLRYWQGEGLTPNMLAQAPAVSVVPHRGRQSTKDSTLYLGFRAMHTAEAGSTTKSILIPDLFF